MTTRRRRGPEDETPSHLRRSQSWAGLRAGDPVRIEGVRLRSASWTFLAHVVNTTTGEQWVEVAGGRPGDRKLRSFRLEQVFPAGRGRTARAAAPLAEAPQLPLG